MKRYVYVCPTGEGECRRPKSCVEFGVAICDKVRESCAEQGIPVKVTDPATIQHVATLLGVRPVQF